MIKRNNQIDGFKIATIVLSVILLLVIGYLGIDKYNERQAINYQQYYGDGYKQAVNDMAVKLYQETEECKITSVQIGEETRQLADVVCIQQVIEEQMAQG